MPSAPEVVTTPAPKRFGKPCSAIAGRMIEPTATTVAGLEPETAANSAQASDAGQPKAAVPVADHGRGEADHPAGDAAMGQEVAGQDEERDRHDLELLDPGEQLQRHALRSGHRSGEQERQHRQPERDRNRHAGQHQREQQAEDDKRRSWRRRLPARPASRPATWPWVMKRQFARSGRNSTQTCRKRKHISHEPSGTPDTPATSAFPGRWKPGRCCTVRQTKLAPSAPTTPVNSAPPAGRKDDRLAPATGHEPPDQHIDADMDAGPHAISGAELGHPDEHVDAKLLRPAQIDRDRSG